MDINSLQPVARTEGLPYKKISKIISLIESKSVPDDQKIEWMKCLIPSGPIQEEAFMRMSCLLSNFTFSVEVKVEILKWMITVYNFLESFDKFRFLYELFFQLLNQDLLRPYVCHILYLLTDKSNLTQQRVHHLERIIEKYGNQNCLVFLRLNFYKQRPDFYGEEIRESLEYQLCPLGVYPDLIKGVHESYNLNTCIFYVTTVEDDSSDIISHVTSESENSSNESYQICQFREICEEFKTLKRSTNVSKILKSKYRRLFLTSDIESKTRTKIYDFILVSLYENFNSRDFLLNMLEIFHDMQGSMLGVSDFTEMLISSWDGESNLDIYTALLQYQPLYCFKNMRYKMDLICEHLFGASVRTKCELLFCFSKMYENWVLQHDRFSGVMCKSNCFDSDGNDNSSFETHEPKEEIEKLRKYLDGICNILIADDNFNPCILNEILLHYERISLIHMKMNMHDVCSFHLPTTTVFCASMFSFSCLSLENISRLMIRYNKEVQKMLSDKHEDGKHASRLFNEYKHDIHILFDEHNKNTILLKKKVSKKLRKFYPKFEELLYLTRHPALIQKRILFQEKFPEGNNLENSAVRKLFLKFLDNSLHNFAKFGNLINA